MPEAEESRGDDAAPGSATVALARDPNTPEALWADFRAALAALTIVARSPDPRPPIGSSALFYPVVGLAIGAVVAVFDWTLSAFLSQEMISVLLVGALALISGGRQLEGFANTADGLIGFRGREWAMATMRDRRLGTSGAAAIFFLLILKVRSLDLVSEPIRHAGVLLPPMVGRWAMVVLARGSSDASVAGGVRKLEEGITMRELALSTALVFLVLAVTTEALGLLVLIAAGALAAGLRVYFHRRLGGITSQSLDAAAEAAETVALMIFALGS
jgi:adenosylcobinamide-GDP ribazoletransferase